MNIQYPILIIFIFISNRSWDHMKQHVTKCKKYREVYKIKLSSKKPSDLVKEQIRLYERDLDEVNIRIQRQLAEREVKKKAEDDSRAASSESGGGFFGWMWGSKKPASGDTADDVSKTVKKLEEALTPAEKAQLYEAIDYQVIPWHHSRFLCYHFI
jgi:vacuolar protein sorting-associated protein 13A/C